MFLSRLLEAVKDVKKAIQQNTSSIRAAEERERQKEPPREPIRRIIGFDDKTVRDTKEESDRQYRTQNSIKRATWFAVAAAVIYAGIAAYQANEMRKATKAATTTAKVAAKQLDVSERPWVNMNIAVGGPLVIDKNGLTMTAKIVVQNTGHSPARTILMESRMRVSSGWPEIEIINEQNSWCDDLKRRAIINEGTKKLAVLDSSSYQPKPLPVARGWASASDAERGSLTE